MTRPANRLVRPWILACTLSVWAGLGVFLLSRPWFSDDCLRLIRSSLNLAYLGTSTFNVHGSASLVPEPLEAWILALDARAHLPLAATLIVLQGLGIVVGIAALAALAAVEKSGEPRPLPSLLYRLMVPALLCGSTAWRAFLFSGTSEALVFGCVGAFGWLISQPQLTSRKALIAGLLASAAMLLQPDLLLAIGLLLAFSPLRRQPRSLALGLAPYFVWAVITKCLGQPILPKTNWQHLAWSLDQKDLLRHGALYFLEAATREPLTLATITLAVVATAVAALRRRASAPPLAFGAACLGSLFWILATGGSDVGGILLCVPLAFAALALVSLPPLPLVVTCEIVVFVTLYFDWPKLAPSHDVRAPFKRTEAIFAEWGIRNERAGAMGKLDTDARSVIRQAQAQWRAESKRPVSLFVSFAPGLDGLKQGPSVAIADARLLAIPRFAPPDLAPPHRSWSTSVSPEPQGALEITFRLNAGAEGSVEPLMTALAPENRFVLEVEHLDPGWIRLRLKIDGSPYLMPAMHPDFGKIHILQMRYGRDATGNVRPGPIDVGFDGAWIRDFTAPRPHYSLGSLTIGWNVTNEAGVLKRYTGDILGVRALQNSAFEQSLWDRPPDGSCADLLVRFTTQAGIGDPLLTCGHDLNTDIVAVKRLAPGKVCVGVEHWGVAPFYGPEIPVDDSVPHHVQVMISPLFTSSFGFFAPNWLRVTIDGRVALNRRFEFYSIVDHGIFLADNPQGGSFNAGRYRGQILSARFADSPYSYHAEQAIIASGKGPITMRLHFGEMRLAGGMGLTGGMGLLESGENGAGDVFSVIRDDPTHISFEFDSWNRYYKKSTPIEIDPKASYDLTLVDDAILPKDRQTGTFKLTLNGKTVLEGKCQAHPSTPGEITLLENAIRSSTGAEPFDTLAESVGREP